MISLAIVFIILLVLPFILGYLHRSFDKKTPKILIYYRYFVVFNMVLAGTFVALRMVLDGPHAAQINGWAFSPLYYLYGAAVISMALTGLIVINSRSKMILMPAILWAVFLLFSTMSYYYDIAHDAILALNIIYLHVLYNLIVASVMVWFLYSFRGFYKEKQQA